MRADDAVDLPQTTLTCQRVAKEAVRRLIFRRLFVLAVILLLPANAFAAALAYVSASALNLRIGPGTNYQIITSLPEGTPVAIHGYGSRGHWCDVSVDDLRGWVWCGYLDSGVTGPILTWGPVLGLSILAYSYDDYYDRYYYDDDYRYRDYKPSKHHRKHKNARHRDRDHDVKSSKRDRKRRTVRHRDRDRDVKSGKRDRKRKTVRKPDRKRDAKSGKRDRKRKTVRKPDRKRKVKSGKRDRKRKTVRHRDRKHNFKPHRSDRKRKIRRRGGGGGKCGSNRRCR
jgi:uncharacterized protein YraI